MKFYVMDEEQALLLFARIGLKAIDELPPPIPRETRIEKPKRPIGEKLDVNHPLYLEKNGKRG